MIVVCSDGSRNRLDQMRLLLLLGHLSRQRTARTHTFGFGLYFGLVGCYVVSNICKHIGIFKRHSMKSRRKKKLRIRH